MRVFALVLLAAIAASADSPAALLAKGRDQLTARHPKEAIPLFTQAIETGRDDLPRATEAVTRLVECYQLLKDDAESARQFKDVVGKYLTTLPPLDGATLPKRETIGDDLLWKSWTPGQRERVSFVIDSVRRTSKSKNGGDPVEELEVIFKIEGGVQVVLVNQRALELVAKAGGRSYRSQYIVFYGKLASAKFLDVPTNLFRFDSLSGVLPLAQTRRREEIIIPLKAQAEWTLGDTTGKLTSVERDGVVLRVSYTTIQGDPEPVVPGRPRDLRAGASSLDFPMLGEEREEGFVLVNSDGSESGPNSTSSHSDGHTSAVDMTFSRAAKADHLVMRRIAELSVHDISINLKDVELP